MASKKTNRRDFLCTGAQAGIAICGLCASSQLFAETEETKASEPLDPKKLNYCGYTCPKDCKFLKGTLENDVELKKEAFKLWKIKERYGIEFDEKQAFCYGCKTTDKPDGIVLKGCTVRACAKEKKLDGCIECEALKTCEKDLWKRFPKFKEQVVSMQERYLKQG